MTRSTSFVNDIKIETVNAKFATSILNETLTKLALVQCAERASNRGHDEKLKDTTTATTKKFTKDLTNIRLTFHKVISDLREHRNFMDFSGVSAAESESNFLLEYAANNVVLNEQCAAIQELQKDIANFHEPTSTVDESMLKCAIQNRFIKKWEKARRDQNDHYNRMLVNSLENEVRTYARNIEDEKRCMLEIETYSQAEMDIHKAESIQWTEKFYVDLNKTEIDIQVALADLDRTKLNYEKTCEAITVRVQEMIDFVALKEERASQKDSAMMKFLEKHREHLLAKCRIFSESI
ncbi:uncharacterized protein LOC119083878 [Bradysia coprophila]|uniref:uncharacterized protein LOC119083878 n=1 Tax=Bradysia coprophila TaxID=38358 RepID=UPI00187D8ECD|nr:uncharacterized protein LOC119083878 [Bradysia coprophila]